MFKGKAIHTYINTNASNVFYFRICLSLVPLSKGIQIQQQQTKIENYGRPFTVKILRKIVNALQKKKKKKIKQNVSQNVIKVCDSFT